MQLVQRDRMRSVTPTPRPRTRKDGTTTWQVPFRHNGRQTSETFHRETDARRFARLITTLGPGPALDTLRHLQTSNTPTLTEYATTHTNTLSGVQHGTRTRYHAYIRNDLGQLAHLPIDTITPDTIAAWVNDLAASGASGKTIANKHGFVAAVLERAVARGLIPSNPCAHTRLPRTARDPMVFLTHAEFARFLDCFEPHWQPLVITLFGTGLRWSEATALQVGDIDTDAHTITVTRAWKAGAGHTLGPPKSDASRRTIVAAPEVMTALAPLLDRPADAWVFTNRHGQPVRHQRFHESVWQPAVRLANGQRGPKPATSGRTRTTRTGLTPLDPPIGKRPRIHDARHSCASWLLGSGIPINYVQAHLGHESITTTVQTYGHVLPAARQAISGAMSAALSSALPQLESSPAQPES